RVYQSVLSSDVQATITSRRIPSTSWAYQRGKVSLSPAVTRIPYGSTELSRSAAKSAVSVWPARDADFQLAKSGISASASTGVARSQLRRRGRTNVSVPIRALSEPNMAATVSQMKTRPSAAHTLHAEKLHR